MAITDEPIRQPSTPAARIGRQGASAPPPGLTSAKTPAAEVGSRSAEVERPAGYAALFRDFGIHGYVPQSQTFLAPKAFGARHRQGESDTYGRVRTVVPGRTAVQESPSGQLLFALKHDGIDLEALRLVFDHLDEKELTAAIREKPWSEYARRAWFLYEWITDRTLDLPSGVKTAYVPLFDPNRYVVCEQGKSTRHGVVLNALGSPQLCPVIRKTAAYQQICANDPLGKRDRLSSTLDPALSERINTFLVIRESHGSFAIEGEAPDAKDDAVFYALLKRITNEPRPQITKELLHDYQRQLLKGFHAPSGGNYRTQQVWVGDRHGDLPVPSHIAPRPQDLPAFMDQYCAIANWLGDASHDRRIEPVAAAATVSGLFAYLHPFMDGNGRLGRLVLQQPLTTQIDGKRLFIPISEAINRHKDEYYQALDVWSRQILGRIKYESHDGGVVVHGETAQLYRFPDLTRYCEFIGNACVEAVEQDLEQERQVLAVYDRVYPVLASFGLDERQSRLFFRIAKQNAWKLSKGKRGLFEQLTDVQVAEAERALLQASTGTNL